MLHDVLTPRSILGSAARVVLLAGLALALVGCKGGGKSGAKPAKGDGAVNTGLAALASGEGESALADRPKPKPVVKPKNDWTTDQALDLQNVLRQLEAEKAKSAQLQQALNTQVQQSQEAAPAEVPAVAAEAPVAPPADPAVIAQAAAPAAPEGVVTNPNPLVEPLEVQIAKTSVSLVDLLRRQSVESPAPFQAYMALAMLEALQPGAVQQIITAQSTSATPLSPEEQRIIDALAAFGRGAHELASLATPGDLFKRLADMTRGVENVLQLRISNAALATRVTSFGRFTPLPQNVFIQGRAVRFLVYCEIEHFAYQALDESRALELSQQEGSGVEAGDRYLVEVSQELQLFAEDGTMVWSMPEQGVTETSRNQRRDFFLTNDVTLPATLSLGKYTLKVIMRDRSTGVADETLLPLEITSDGTLANVSR